MNRSQPTDDEIRELLTISFRVAYRILGSRPAAEDAAQNTVAKAVARWSKVGSYAAAWCSRVAANDAIGTIRSRRRRLPDPGVATGDEAAASVQRMQLQAALRTLPKRQREVVVLRFLADLSVDQTADALRISSGSVKTHTSRGLLALRAALGEGPFTEVLSHV